MSVRNRTEAYDLSLFDTHPLTGEVGGRPAPKPSQKKQPRSNVIELPQRELDKTRRTHSHYFKAVGVVMVLTLMLTIVGSVVFNQVQLNELTTQISQAEKDLAEQQSVHTQLQMKANSNMTLSDVEAYAQEELGMKKTGKSQVTYITLTEGDQGTVVQPGGEESLLDRVWSFLQGLLE